MKPHLEIKAAARMQRQFMSMFVVCVIGAALAVATVYAQEAPASENLLSKEELASLVGPLALYPDPLLIQVLAASTYPLEIVQLKQWLDKNKKLKGQALIDAVAQQNWDPSVQALSAFPAVVDKLFNNIQWTTDLGNAFLAQQSDLMDAVQQLRATAQANGALKTNDKQSVSTEQDGTGAITIEPAQRDVVYVPTYNTQYVYRDSDYSNYSGYSDYSGYGSSGYSGDGYSYLGYAIEAAYGAYWGYYNWRDRYAEQNYNNYYNRNWNNKVNSWNKNTWKNNGNNFGNGNRTDANRFSQRPNEGSGRWQHDPGHRGNTPYGNRNLSERFGQPNNRLGAGEGGRASQLASARNQLARNNFSRAPGESARSGMGSPGAGAPNRIGNRAPSNFNGPPRGGAFNAPRGDFARASSLRGADSLRPPANFRGGPPEGFRGGPPEGFRGGGPPMGGGFRGGPPPGGFGGGGPPMGGAPPPPPHP